MWKRIAIVGATAAIIGGAGTAAFAASGTPTPTPAQPAPSVSSTSDIVASPAPTSTVKHPGATRLGRAVYATWVTQNKKTGTFTTHDAIRGQVSAVTPTSITVRGADGHAEIYAIGAHTKVFTRAPRAAGSTSVPPQTASSISVVNPGDAVFVGGTGRAGLTAVRVIDVKG